VKIRNYKHPRGLSFDNSKRQWRVRHTTGERQHVAWTRSLLVGIVAAIVFTSGNEKELAELRARISKKVGTNA
jgi:hypothetical protein